MGTSADLTSAATLANTDVASLFDTHLPAMRTARDTAYTSAVSAKGATYGVNTVQTALSDERIFALLVSRFRASATGQAFLNYIQLQGAGSSLPVLAMAPVSDLGAAISSIAGAAPLSTWLT